MTFKVREGLIGSATLNPEYFLGSDTEENFNNKLYSQPEDWYYRNIKIIYKYNYLGHRCADIKDIDFNNYILFVGCSHTFGVGNRLEDTYSYLLSKKLNMDYYNLALGGTSTDTCIHNLSIWLQKFQKPKFIIWQWSPPNRFLYTDNKHSCLLEPAGRWMDDENIKRSIYFQDELNSFFVRDYLAINYLRYIKNNIPIFEIAPREPWLEFHCINLHGSDILYFDIADKARDDSHHGPNTQVNLTNLLYKKIEETLLIDK